MGLWRTVNLVTDAMDSAAAPAPLAHLAPRIRRQYLRLRLASRAAPRGPGHVTRSILGHAMRADRVQNLLLLFSEVFVHHEYGFPCDRPDPVIIDGGANVGMATLYFTMAWPAASITCVEGAPDAFAHLSENARANSWSNVRAVNAALAPAPGTIPFYTDPDNPASPTGSLLAERGGSRAVQVRAITLSSLIPERVDLLKLDIEGAESGVIEELAASGAIARVRRIALEFHHHLTPGDDGRLPRILGLLAGCGMRFQVRAPMRRVYAADAFQDLLIHAYRPA